MTPEAIAESYRRDGYAFPVPVLSREEAAETMRAFEALEARHGDRLDVSRYLKYDPHYTIPLAARLMRHPGMLSIARAVLGDDLMVSNVNIFLKEPSTADFISWHQDLHYVGIAGTEYLTVWLALTEAGVDNGCMRFLPGSHRARLPHRDTVDPANMLTRGQVIDPPVDEARAVDVVLAPGEASVHHGMTAHASNPNRSSGRRVGFAVRYMAPHVRQEVAAKDYGILVSGEDRYRHFESPPLPETDFDPEALARYEEIVAERRAFLFQGLE